MRADRFDLPETLVPDDEEIVTFRRGSELGGVDLFVRTINADAQDSDRQEREYNARAMLEELTAVADWFGSVRGRKKSILLFSEGISYDIHDPFAGRDELLGEQRAETASTLDCPRARLERCREPQQSVALPTIRGDA